MAFIVQRLPIELRRVVYNYARPIQNSELLYDIRNYKNSLNIILNREKPRHLILNDIWIFLGLYCGSYYKIWERIPKTLTLRQIKFWIGNYYSKKDYKSQIKILWGLLTPTERDKFLKIPLFQGVLIIPN